MSKRIRYTSSPTPQPVVAPDHRSSRRCSTRRRLSTGSTPYRWMNDVLAVSTGERDRDTVRIHVHEVL
jgi:hypothetical protein